MLSKIKLDLLKEAKNINKENFISILNENKKININFNDFELIELLNNMKLKKENIKNNQDINIINKTSKDLFNLNKMIEACSENNDDSKLISFIYELKKRIATYSDKEEKYYDYKELKDFIEKEIIKIKKETISYIYCCFNGLDNEKIAKIVYSSQKDTLINNEKKELILEFNIIKMLKNGYITAELLNYLKEKTFSLKYINKAILIQEIDLIKKGTVFLKRDFINLCINNDLYIDYYKLMEYAISNDDLVFFKKIEINDKKFQIYKIVDELILKKSKNIFNYFIKEIKEKNILNNKEMGLVFKDNIYLSDDYNIFLIDILNMFDIYLNIYDLSVIYKALIFDENNLELVKELNKFFSISINVLEGYKDGGSIHEEMVNYLFSIKELRSYALTNKDKVSKNLLKYISKEKIKDF